MSTPPTPDEQVAVAAEPCASCAAPLADDQRYCLQCGEPRHGKRRALPAILRRPLDGGREAGAVATRAPSGGERWPTLAETLAGVACLLLAMGVGVLIGRGSGDTAQPAVITIAGAPAAAGAAPASTAAFTSDWPAGKDGWTIALDVLPKASTQPGAVVAAKAAATDKGAPEIGALDSGEYGTLTAGSYLVYSGVYDAEKAAKTALSKLKASFAGARVVRVAATAPTSSGTPSTPSSRATSKRRSSPPAGKSSAADDTKKAFEETKKAPKTVGTGGKPPPKDNKPAGAGSAVEDIG